MIGERPKKKKQRCNAKFFLSGPVSKCNIRHARRTSFSFLHLRFAKSANVCTRLHIVIYTACRYVVKGDEKEEEEEEENGGGRRRVSTVNP